jgi:co-chaperonin GroES (HSP10)
MIRIRPLGGKVLLRMVGRAAEENVGGIIVRREAKREDRREAVVQALPDRFVGDLSVGDTVFVKPYAGTEVVINGENLVFCKQDEIEAVLE